jgi:hypothetical protein
MIDHFHDPTLTERQAIFAEKIKQSLKQPVEFCEGDDPNITSSTWGITAGTLIT